MPFSLLCALVCTNLIVGLFSTSTNSNDGSDKRGCLWESLKTDDHIKCASDNTLILRKYKCNGEADCADASDEADCNSHQLQFTVSPSSYASTADNHTSGPLFLLSSRSKIHLFNLEKKEQRIIVNAKSASVVLDFHLDNDTVFFADSWNGFSSNRILVWHPWDSNGTSAEPQPLDYEILAIDTKWKWKNGFVVFKDNIDKPRGIAVDPSLGLIFWTDWGAQPRIERGGMNGQDRVVISPERHIAWPNGLTLDLHEKRVYWVDGLLQSIMSSDYWGQDLRVLKGQEYIGFPFSIAVFDDRLFYTDWDLNAVVSLNKETGNDFRVELTTASTPMAVRVMDRAAQPQYASRCAQDACSQICLPRAEYTANSKDEEMAHDDTWFPFECFEFS